MSPQRGPRFGLRPHQADRLAGHAHAGLELGTDRNELEMLAEHVGHVAVVLVPGVEAHALAEEAARDADANFLALAERRPGRGAGGISAVRGSGGGRLPSGRLA